ncbi:hypothetical protein VTN00DRAFT_7012 [Thermoascus crustaceus]|uniref:uncharacterized protein n=1 Tax=Thermoascus crustaceus TaxID=5088 RepID=UPI0037433651
MGAQVVNNYHNDKKKKKKGPDGGEDDDGRRILHDLHTLASIHLSGEALDELTKRFIETLCEDIDRRFPPRDNKDDDDDGDDNEWEILDLCTYVKSTWTHASITALFGSSIHTLWPDIDTWLWDFDAHFQKIVSRMPRFLFPRAYALRDEGLRMCMFWEEEALRAEKEGMISSYKKIEGDNENDGALWDPYWGHRYTRLRAKRMMENGISARGRAGNAISLLWGLNANAIPVAMQVINQSVLNPSSLLTDLLAEISTCQTGPVSFDMSKITTRPKLRSVYLEALRWATASLSPRVVREDCELEGCGYRYRFRANSMVIVHSRTLQMDPATWEIPGRPESDPVRFWAGRFLLDEDGDKDDDTNTNTNSNDGEAERMDEIAEAEAEYIADTTTTVAITSTNNNNSDKPSPVTNERILIKPISLGPKPKSSTKTDTTTPQKQQQQQRLSSLRPYGGGTTLCPGRHFATNEILGGLAALLLRLEIEVIEEELVRNGVPQPDLMKQGGLFPDRPLMVRVRRRRRSRFCT